MSSRYADEVRQFLTTVDQAEFVRELRVGRDATWRAVGRDMSTRWETDIAAGDLQSLGRTICEVAAELLGEGAVRSLELDRTLGRQCFLR